MPSDWFHALFGFEESRGSIAEYQQTKSNLRLLQDPPRIASEHAEYIIGEFHALNLRELREAALAQIAASPETLAHPMTLDHALGDVSVLIGSNPNAVFQAASQFNCLEFVNPNVTPEQGVTAYACDRTQGPACSIACGPATVYRNYFAPVEVRDRDGNQTGTQEGQTAEHQVDNLWEVCRAVGNTPRGRFYDIVGGYTLATDDGLKKLNTALSELDREAVKNELKVGVHSDCQVTSTNWGRHAVNDPAHTVTQVFCSACSVAYSHNPGELWGPFASLVLEACYEATLWAAVAHAIKHKDDPRARIVFLTAVGGGVFGNDMGWVANAIQMAMERVEHAGVGLDVRIVSYCPPIERQVQELVDSRKPSVLAQCTP